LPGMVRIRSCSARSLRACCRLLMVMVPAMARDGRRKGVGIGR
jgi:hypothetical protein